MQCLTVHTSCRITNICCTTSCSLTPINYKRAHWNLEGEPRTQIFDYTSPGAWFRYIPVNYSISPRLAHFAPLFFFVLSYLKNSNHENHWMVVRGSVRSKVLGLLAPANGTPCVVEEVLATQGLKMRNGWFPTSKTREIYTTCKIGWFLRNSSTV